MAAMVDGVIYDTWDSRIMIDGTDLFVERIYIKDD